MINTGYFTGQNVNISGGIIWQECYMPAN
jgi:hypothetical protein